jgi:hypothetical protein
MISYNNTQDETISKGHAMISESTYMCVTLNKYQKTNTKTQNNTVAICDLVIGSCGLLFVIWFLFFVVFYLVLVICYL